MKHSDYFKKVGQNIKKIRLEKGIKKKEIKKVDPELFVMTLMAIPRTYVLSEVLVADIMKTKNIDAVYSKELRERLKTYMNSLIKAMLEK